MRVGLGVGNNELIKRLGIKPAGEADVIFLTIADALLGASGLGGLLNTAALGFDSAGTSALMILKEVERQVHYTGYRIINTDISISESGVQNTGLIIRDLCAMLFLKKEQINIKLTPVLPGNMLCLSVVLLNHRNQ